MRLGAERAQPADVVWPGRDFAHQILPDNANGTDECRRPLSTAQRAVRKVAAAGISPADLIALSVTGNTTCCTFWLAWIHRRWASFYCAGHVRPPGERCVAGLNAGGEVYRALHGAFVGSDIVAILSSGMMKDDVSLLLDIGTNGEVALNAYGQLFVSPPRRACVRGLGTVAAWPRSKGRRAVLGPGARSKPL